MKTIDAVLQHIYARVRDKINPSLVQIRALLHELGNPQLDYPTCHVIGTNGKGTAARILSALLEREGQRTGLYTSPHLVSARERIVCDSKPITVEEFLAVWEQLRPAAERWDATFFEVFTAMAFSYFKQRQVDAAVIEAGLGGTWDATSVIQPQVLLLTAVQLDHTDRLGKTVETIARDKAGAMKSGVPFVCGERDPQLQQVLREEARHHQTPFYLPEDIVTATGIRLAPQHTTLTAHFTESDTTLPVVLPYCGRYQVDNFLAAAAAFTMVKGRPPQGDELDLTPWPWPGRFDLVSQDPLVLVDSAHNPDAARALFAAIRELYPARELVVLYGTLDDKDWRGCLEVIAADTQQLFPLAIEYHRGLPVKIFAAGVEQLFPAAPSPAPFREVWPQVCENYQPDQLIVACGSFHVAEAVYRQLDLDPFSRRSLED